MEWESSCDKDEQNDAKRPDVSSLPRIAVLLDQIRTHIVRSAALQGELLILLAAGRKAEIDDFYYVFVFRIIDQDIF